MKAIILSSEFPPGPGGIGVHAFELSKQLQKHGIKVSIFANARKLFSPEKFDLELPFKIFRLHWKSHFRILKNLSVLHNSLAEADWIFASGLRMVCLAGLAVMFRPVKLMVILHGHEILMAKGIWRQTFLMAVRRSSRIVCVSEFAKQKLLNEVTASKVDVIPNGVSQPKLHAFRTAHIGKGKIRLITVGSVTPRKGQHNVVKALPAISNWSQVEYHIVGMPETQVEIEALAESLGVSSKVFFYGVVSEDVKIKLIAESNIFMMLSENQLNGDVEGFGIAVLEANMLGIPAIGARETGVEQAIDTGRSGLLVAANSPDEISWAAREIMNNWMKYSQGAREWALAHDWEIIGKRYIDLLN